LINLVLNAAGGKQAQEQQDHKDDREDVEQNTRYLGARCRNAAKAEDRGDDGNQKKYQSPF
jgi:hypothetical protein